MKSDITEKLINTLKSNHLSHLIVNQNKHNKDSTSHSPSDLDNEEQKVITDDEYRQSGKNKPKIITGKLPSAFSNPQVKHKNKQNDQYIK